MSYKPQGPPSYEANNSYNGPPPEEHEYSQQGYSVPNSGSDHQQQQQANYGEKPGSGVQFEERFKVEKPKFNDIPFSILFLAVCGGFLAVAGISLKSYVSNRGFEGTSIYDSKNDFGLNTNTIVLFAFTTVMAVVLSVLYYLMARMYPKQFIVGTMILHVIISIGTSIYLLVEKYWSAGIVGLIFGVFSAWCYWTMRHRIPFAALVFTTIIDVTRRFPQTVLVSILGSLFAGAFSAFFSVTMVAVYVKYHPSDNSPTCADGGSCSSAKVVGLMIFITFAGYYISEVIKNVIHTTICGIYGSWYYCFKSDEGMPRWPALGAFKRSMTYSFGSISFGSLIVAIINLIKNALTALRQSNSQDGGNMAITVLLWIAGCIMSLIDWLAQWFNHYAYVYIALYGKAYLPAANDTWNVLRRRGIDALVNDSLVGNVLTFGSTIVGYLCALFGYLYLRLTSPAYNSTGGYYPIIVAYAFLIGTQVTNIATVSITSGVSTFFVALAKDPEVFKMSYPDVYENLCQVYPPAREKLNL